MNSFRSIDETDKFAASSFCPENLRDLGESPNARLCTEILSELKESLITSQKRSKDLDVASNKFRGRFSKRNTFKFKTELNTEADFMEFADNLSDFLLNEKIEDYRERTSNRYSDILARIAKEIGDVTRQRAEIEKIISGVNRDFIEKNFAGVIKSIALRTEESNDKLMRLTLVIQKFFAENQYALGEINLFSTGNTENANREAVNLLLQFMKSLNEESQPHAAETQRFVPFAVPRTRKRQRYRLDRQDFECRFRRYGRARESDGEHHAHQRFQDAGIAQVRRIQAPLYDGRNRKTSPEKRKRHLEICKQPKHLSGQWLAYHAKRIGIPLHLSARKERKNADRRKASHDESGG